MNGIFEVIKCINFGIISYSIVHNYKCSRPQQKFIKQSEMNAHYSIHELNCQYTKVHILQANLWGPVNI